MTALTGPQSRWLKAIKGSDDRELKIGRFGVPYKTARKLSELGLVTIVTVRRASGYGSDEFARLVPEKEGGGDGLV